MGPIQVLLIGVVGFIGGIDQFSFLESLYRPIVLCTVVGFILGNIDLGLKIGASYELMMVGNMPVGGSQPPNVVIGGIMAVVFASASGNPDFESALGLAVPFSLLGQYAVNVVFTVTSPLMAKADEMAAKGDAKGIELLNIGTMCFIGSVFAIIAMVGAVSGATIGDWLTANLPATHWIWRGLGAAGGMMRFVGFAVLMKVMISSDTWTILFAGFALATIIDRVLPGHTLVMIALIGLALAVYDFQTNIKMKNSGGQGGVSDGI